MSSPTLVTVEALAKRYGDATVFDGVNFTLSEGEFVCIIGHSGCGKTTILNVLAGLEQASSGHVFMANREVAGPGLERGVVFQGHALMPWLTVRQNIAFAVRSKWPDWTRAQVDAQVVKYVELVGLAASATVAPAPLADAPPVADATVDAPSTVVHWEEPVDDVRGITGFIARASRLGVPS